MILFILSYFNQNVPNKNYDEKSQWFFLIQVLSTFNLFEKPVSFSITGFCPPKKEAIFELAGGKYNNKILNSELQTAPA